MDLEYNGSQLNRRLICAVIGIILGAIITGWFCVQRATMVDEKIKSMQTQLSKEVFRFHVLADSDSNDAQRVKRKVRDHILKYMKESMPGSAEVFGASQTKQWAMEHTLELKKIAEETIREEGFFYGARAEVVTCYFPEKRYGEVVFPEGYYEALRICLGKAKGRNWWCCLYPNLCFKSAARVVVDEEGQDQLKSALSSEEYEMVTATADFKLKSFFFDRYRDWRKENEKQ